MFGGRIISLPPHCSKKKKLSMNCMVGDVGIEPTTYSV